MMSRLPKTLCLSLSLAAILIAKPAFAQSSEPTAYLTVQGQGLAPNQVVTLATSPTQKLSAIAAANGSVAFNNLKYTPSTNLAFALSYQVKETGSRNIPNDILINLNPFTGTVDVKGNATKAASVVINVSSEDSRPMIANQNGYFSGSAESISGFSDGALRVVASIINVSDTCCPRELKPFAPVTFKILSQPAKKAALNSVTETSQTAKLEISLPAYSYGVSVPSSMINDSWVNGFHNFTNRIIETLQMQTASLGSLLNAQNHVDATRSLQQSSAATAKNYLPSEQLCRYGTLSQSLVASESRNRASKTALLSALQDLDLGTQNTIGGDGNLSKAQWDHFKTTNCDKTDGNSALSSSCKKSADDTRFNNDVDYTKLIDAPLTLKINFTQGAGGAEEQDIMSIAQMLFPPRQQQKGPDQTGYLQNNASFRSLEAIRSVAKNSFAAQVTEKSEGTAGSAKFISKLMQSLGISSAEADTFIGENPSYYAQMEVLTKKIFQDPGFYVNLLDTPANVERQRAAIRAIKLQQQNDFAQLVKRREMLLATLLEMKLRERSKTVNARINPVSDQ